MHHKDDLSWRDEDVTDMLQSTVPPNFHKVLAAHYRERLQEIIKEGMEYTGAYFCMRDHLKYHEKKVR